MQADDAERRSSWSSWVYTPLKALKESYNYLSKSPIKTDEVDENVGGHHVNQTASSTAAALVEEGEAQSQKAADQFSSREEQAGPSQPVDMALPDRLLSNLPSLPSRPGAVTPARPSEGAGSSYEDIRARNVTLLSNSPLAAGSPWQPRLRPGSGSLQPSPAQSSGAAGTPIGQAPPSLSNRPFHSVGPSRFGLRDGPAAPSPLALTPLAQPFRTTAARGSRPFARTPIHMQPLSGAVPAASVPASAAGTSAAPEPAPLSWTPMRTYSSMQPRAGATLSLKRGRAEGSPLGTPLLGAGLAADSDRRIRRRGEQGPGSAERRVWKAGQTPRNTKASEVLALEGPSGATQVPNGLSGRREPLPMTESARRIAMALDAMLPTASSQGQADTAAASAPEKPVAPPSESLGVAPAPLLSSPAPTPTTPSLTLSPMDAFPKPAATFSWGSQPQPAFSAAETAAASGSHTQRPTVVSAAPPTPSWSSWAPSVSLPKGKDSTAGSQQLLSSPTPNAPAALPLTPVGLSLPQPSLFNFSNAQKVDKPLDGPMATEELEVVAAKFSFRPARSLTDSAEKLRPPSQPQPTPEKVLEENNRAAAAASQPLPVSDDEEDEHLDEDGSEDGDIKGVTRSSAHAGENGNGPAVSGAAAASAPAPAAGGWGADFLKQNQAQAAAAKEAAEKAIAAAEKGGAQSQPQPSAAAGGWGADFLKSNKATGDAAGAALQAELEKEAGKTNSGPTPTPFTITFGKPQAPAPDTAASSGSGLLSFLGSVVPGSTLTAFAPSTSSGSAFGLKQPAEAAVEPAATCAITAVAPASTTMPSFLTSSTPSANGATENGDAPVSAADGPVWALPKKVKADDAPPPKLKPSAAPFAAPNAFLFGKPAVDAAKEDGQKAPEPAPTGLSLTHAQGSGRSLDSNMSVSPSAGSAGAANPFVALETGPTPEVPSTTGFPIPSFMAPASSAAASSFTFMGAPAASAATSSGFLAPAAGTGMGFKSGSIAFGAGNTPNFGPGAASAPAQSSAPVGMFGANANSAFGAAASAPAFGGSAVTAPAFGAASAPAFGATQSGSLAFGASGTPAFGASSAPAFGAGSTPAFGAASTPAFGAASMPAFGASSTPAFGQASAPAFGAASASAFSGFGSGGGFGAPASAPAFGGFGGGAGAFGAQPQSAPAAGAPFGASHTTPAWGAQAGTTPTFGQPPAQPGANAAPGPFGAPLQPAFGMQQQQQPAPANPFGFQGAPSGGVGGDAASGFTMGAGDSQQPQAAARRKLKAKRKGR
ncbi:hypothetical protein WJX75_000598 [Coccomyxa subellipsoidea]|uniref:Nuclear pore complex NUP2/50/61 domain-containing protein n=1 Tax=Coccomyxa subellipsoidea TaxID=248742 RepID=A0ABR2YWJ2_9CHLO